MTQRSGCSNNAALMSQTSPNLGEQHFFAVDEGDAADFAALDEALLVDGLRRADFTAVELLFTLRADEQQFFGSAKAVAQTADLLFHVLAFLADWKIGFDFDQFGLSLVVEQQVQFAFVLVAFRRAGDVADYAAFGNAGLDYPVQNQLF